MTMIIGAGGGGGKGGKGGSSRTPKTAPDSLDSRQYANVIDLISEGEIEGLADGLKSIYLNNTPLQNPDNSYNFEDVEVFQRTGTQDQSYIQLNPGVQDTQLPYGGYEDEKPVGIQVFKDVPITRSITDVNVDAVRVTISIPALQNISKKTGDTKGTNVSLKIAVQYAGGGFVDAAIGRNGATTDVISGRTADEYRKDYLINLNRPTPSDVVDIRVTRITEDSTDSLLSNAFSWASYTEIIYAKLSYPNSALIGLRVDAEQFSSIPSRSYLIKGVKVQVPSNATVEQVTGALIYSGIWDGTFSAATWTSDPAWILWDLLTNTRYGFGEHIQASSLDKWSFYAASRYCSALDTRPQGTTNDYHPSTGKHGVEDGLGNYEPRFSCNTTIQTAEEAYKLVNDLLSVMRCQGFWSSGSLTIAQDRAGTDPAYLFTMANVTAEGFSYSGSSLKARPNVAVVSYLDIGRYDYTQNKWVDGLRDTAYEVVEDTEAIDKYGAVRTEISAFACTSRGQANRIGRWLLYSERYENEVVSFSSSLEAGQQVRPGQIILIADPVKAGSRRAGRIAAATTTIVTVDDTATTNLSYEGGSTLSAILPDGTVETREVSSIDGADITVLSPFTAAPATNTVWILESPTLQASTWRVLSVQEQDGTNYAITALKHDESKYSYIEKGKPLQPRDITNLNVIPASPTDLAVLDVPQIGGGTSKETQYELNGKIAIKVTFHWSGPQGIKSFRVKYRHEDDNFTTRTVQGTTFDIEDAKIGNYQVQVSSISTSGVLYSEPAILSYDVGGVNTAPADVTGLTLVPVSESMALLTWTQAPDLDVRVGGKVIIRHDPLSLPSAEWAASTQIVDAVAGSATQKQVPLLPGTYFVKFEDYLGNRSVNATGFKISLPQYESRLRLNLYVNLDYVADYYYGGVQWQEQDLVSPYSGTSINCVYDSTETALVIAGGAEYVEAGYSVELYTLASTLSPYVDIDYYEPIYALGDLYAEYYFAETLDLGAVYDVNFRRYVRVRPLTSSTLFDSASGLFDSATGFFDGTGVDAVNLVTYIRATNDNPAGSPTWGPWTEALNCVVQGRAFQIKAVLTTNTDLTGIAVEELAVIPEIQRRVTSSPSPVRTTSTVFEHAFYDLRSVNITPVAMDAGQRFELASAGNTGFTVNFFAGSNALEEDYNYTATGFGRAV